MATKPKKTKKPDDFASVARRLECDPDMEKFDENLRKIARAKVVRGEGHGGK